MNKYPNLCLSLLLAFTLTIPFILTKKRRVLEPYPAIVLPAGASRASLTNKTVSFKRIDLLARHELDNTWVKVDAYNFIAPIPVQYLSPILKNSFGLNSAEGRVTNLFNGINILSKKVTPSEVEAAKDWFRQKLVQSGHTSNELMISFERVEFDVETGKIVKVEREDEKIIRLD